MADLSGGSSLPRRAVITGVAAFMASPAIAQDATRDPAFSEKLGIYKAARAAYVLASNAVDERLEALGPCQSLPPECRDEWRRKVREIEDSTTPSLVESDRAAFAVIRHPVFTLAELREKIRVAEEAFLFDHDDADECRDCILRDVMAITEADHA